MKIFIQIFIISIIEISFQSFGNLILSCSKTILRCGYEDVLQELAQHEHGLGAATINQRKQY